MIRLLPIPLAIVVLVVLSMLWSGGGKVAPADFTFINRGEVGTLDPNRMSWMQDIRLGYALWEGLYTLDPVTLQAIPGCADPIDLSADKTVYTFHIRPNARWSNGDEVVADDFVFAWRRMFEEPGDYTYLLECIKGAEDYEKAFADHKPARFEDVGVTALDARTLRVTLKYPVAYFPDICAFPPAFPLNRRSMEPFIERAAGSDRTSYDKAFTLPPNLVTNGPYKLVSWQFKQRLRMEANEYYWNRASVKSRIIEQVSADDPLWAYTMYDTKGVDWIAEVTGDIAGELLKKKDKDLHVFPAFGTYFYSFNCLPKLKDGSDNPFADVHVRRAFTMALDKQVIVDTITRMGEPITTTYIPRGAFARYKSPAGLPMDIEQARRLLAEAGYPQGRGFPAVTLLFNNEGQHGAIAQNVRRQWLDNLGVDVRLEGIEIKQFRERLHNKDYAVARASWFGDYNDPSTFTDKYLPDAGNNDSAWKNQKYKDLCDAAAREPDPDQRMKLFEQAETILLDEAPILPIYTYVNAYLYRNNVTGIPLNPRAMIMMQSVQVKR